MVSASAALASAIHGAARAALEVERLSPEGVQPHAGNPTHQLHAPEAGLRLFSGSEWTHLILYWIVFTACWVLLLYYFMWTEPRWMKGVPESLKPHENTPIFTARCVTGIIHSVLLAGVTIPLAVILLRAPTHVQFASTTSLGECRLDPNDAALKGWNGVSEAVGFAAMAAATFLLADLVIMTVYKQMTMDYLVHHVAFIIAGTLMRVNCFLPLNGTLLLSMEASTPFLNYLQLFRNRGSSYAFSVNIAAALFFVLFILIRIVLNTYGIILLWTHVDVAWPSYVPKWEFYVVMASTTAGCLVQYYWLPGIMRTFCKAMFELITPVSLAKTILAEDVSKAQTAEASLPDSGVAGKRESLNTIEEEAFEATPQS